MSMRILLFLNSLIPVSNYGGTQRVMWSLGKALTQMGHKVYFLAKAGSTCDFASVIPYDSAVDLIKQIPQDVDVVHFNGTIFWAVIGLILKWVCVLRLLRKPVLREW